MAFIVSRNCVGVICRVSAMGSQHLALCKVNPSDMCALSEVVDAQKGNVVRRTITLVHERRVREGERAPNAS